MIATVVDGGKLLGVVLYALAATIGVATLFSLAIFGVVQAGERRVETPDTALAYVLLAVLCVAGCLAAAAYGIVLLASK